MIHPDPHHNDDLFLSFDKLIEAAPDEVTTAQPAPAPLDIKRPIETLHPTMSSLQIADITGKEHRNVTIDISRILGEVGIDAQGFLHIYRDTQNREQKCYLLPRRECDLVVSGYSAKYRLAIIDRWQELESKQSFHIPQTLPEALRLAADLSEELIESKAALAIAAPKAAGLDRIADSSGSLTITEAAKTLGIPPRRLFEQLSAKRWIYRRGKEWLPYQDKQDRGLMTSRAVTFTASDGDRTTTQARITPKGLALLSTLSAA